MSGPGVRDGASQTLPGDASALPELGSVYDVLPSLLAHFGLPAGLDMAGRVLDVLDASPPPPRASDDADPSWRLRRVLNRPEALVIPAASRRIEQLRALGYIE